MSSTVGSDVMYVSNELAGTNSLHSEHINYLPGSTSSRSITIKKTTASQFCLSNNIHTIHLLKVDTEGHDMEAIIGALPLLKEGRIAVLQFEYNH